MTAKEMFLGEGWARLLNTALYGSSAGMAAGSLLAYNKIKKDRPELERLALSNPVDSKEFVAEHAPDIKVTSSEKDININKYGPLNQFLIKRNLKNSLPSYISGQKEIIAPKSVNKYLLAHEIGHDIYEKNNKRVSLFELLTGLSHLTGKRLKVEEGAWAASPIDIKDEGIKIRDNALSGYKTENKYFRAGTIAGTILGAGLSVPHLLKHLKK